MYISNSKTNTSFSNSIYKSINSEYLHMADPAWILFLQDHRNLIKSHSTTYILTEEIMNRYQYCIRSFLTEEMHSFAGLDQAFRVVNKLHSEMEFTLELGTVYVPDAAYIQTLRNEFMTIRAQEANA